MPRSTRPSSSSPLLTARPAAERRPPFVSSSALGRLWLLPVAVAIAYLITISLPIGEKDGFSDNALIVLEVIFGTLTVTVVVSAVLAPGAAAHTLLMHRLETRRVSLAVRTVVAVLLSPLLGAWLFVFAHEDHDGTGWSLYFGSSALFAVASVWYGSRGLRRVDTARLHP